MTNRRFYVEREKERILTQPLGDLPSSLPVTIESVCHVQPGHHVAAPMSRDVRAGSPETDNKHGGHQTEIIATHARGPRHSDVCGVHF